MVNQIKIYLTIEDRENGDFDDFMERIDEFTDMVRTTAYDLKLTVVDEEVK